MPDLLTIGDMQKITGAPAHIIRYAISRYGPEPVGRIGIARVWPREAIGDIRASLEKTAANCTRRRGAR